MIPVAGIQPFTTIDYPGALACVLFTQGCSWKCRYCHNTELQTFKKTEGIRSWQEVKDFLSSRQNLLEAVVVSGGEPTAHAGLEQAIREIKDLGFKVGLHTAGMHPERLRSVLPLVDWVGFDFKAPLDKNYDRITQVPHSADAVTKSLDYLLESGVTTQFRCTWHPALLTENDLLAMDRFLQSRGVKTPLVIQKFRTQGCADRELMGMDSLSELPSL